MSFIAVSVPAGSPIYLPKNAVIKGMDIPDGASVDSDCFDLTDVPEFECFGIYFCIAGDPNSETINYAHIFYTGVIINNVFQAFATPVEINMHTLGDADSIFATGAAEIVTQMQQLPQAQQGILRDFSVCDAVGDDNDASGARGTCILIMFKTLPAIAKEMVMTSYIITDENQNANDTPVVYYPVEDEASLEDREIATCGCGTEGEG